MNNNYEFLLSDISKLKNVGKKTSIILKKKKLTQYLIYYGDFPKIILIDQTYLK